MCATFIYHQMQAYYGLGELLGVFTAVWAAPGPLWGDFCGEGAVPPGGPTRNATVHSHSTPINLETHKDGIRMCLRYVL